MSKWKRFIQKMLFLTAALCAFSAAVQAEPLDVVSARKGKTEISGMTVSVGKAGFHPSEDNYLRIKADISLKNRKTQARLRIINSSGRSVYIQYWNSLKLGSGNTSTLLDTRWDGKVSEDNTAGLTAGDYVEEGIYKAEILAYYRVGKKLYSSKKTKSFKVSYSAPEGTAGVAAAKTYPIYTSFGSVDYLAKLFVDEAGVESSMCDDDKIRLIYHWMTTHFRHVHSGSRSKYPEIYHIDEMKEEIAAYKKKSDRQVKKGKRIYSFECARCENRMTHLYGVCTDHAAIFKLLLNHVGVEAGICRGYYIYRNGGRTGHYWNYAIVDGVKYYYDVDVEIQNYGKGQGDYYWYKDTREKTLTRHYFLEEDWYLYDR